MRPRLAPRAFPTFAHAINCAETGSALSHSFAVFVRSLVFNALFYINIIARMIVALPTLLLPRSFMLGVLRHYSRSTLWLLRVICNVKVEWRGREKLPQGAYIVACKHQSLWETFALFMLLPDPTYVLKRELMWIPLFGWLASKARMIPINRGARAAALSQMATRVREEIASGARLSSSPKERGARRAPSRGICPVSLTSTLRSACPACQSHSIPDCSGHAARSAVIPEQCWSKSLTRSNPVSTSAHFLNVYRPCWRKQPRGSSPKANNQVSRGAEFPV